MTTVFQFFMTIRPEHFAKPDERHRFRRIPFLGCPKKCLGDTPAMIEMKLVVRRVCAAARNASRQRAGR